MSFIPASISRSTSSFNSSRSSSRFSSQSRNASCSAVDNRFTWSSTCSSFDMLELNPKSAGLQLPPYAPGKPALDIKNPPPSQRRPAFRVAAINRLISAHRRWRRMIQRFVTGLGIALGQLRAKTLQLRLPLAFLLFLAKRFRRRIVFRLCLLQFLPQRRQIHNAQLLEVEFPIRAQRLEPAENHRINRRQVRAIRNPDRAQVKPAVIHAPQIIVRPGKILGQKSRGSPKRPYV